ncbi:TetR/AcrR family transcriptional regulator [Phenylobacterium soli]|uniref:TetR/AcrR family transcriptional regulator n=1 Tax=Phenylobacterium soli TaxID=2170551 RepID=A0A328AJG4_9CAUL|nr:TetR/AcrR family transcriptional regulator [Phenylobacterium soli]RAK55012.1 TetR/AcrR family transcriptional regulator [Phenylobacterium soli]
MTPPASALASETGRVNQKRRTRKTLLETAARLAREGRTPTLEEVAEAALVSRATAYRYFPSIEALMVEAALDVAVPEPDALFAGGGPADAVARFAHVEAALHEMMAANEVQLRMMLVHSLERRLRGEADDGLPARQNRRVPLLEAALEPVKDEFAPADRRRLIEALSLIVGIEAIVVLKDVLQLDEPQIREVKRWAVKALVEAARKQASSPLYPELAP